MAIKGRSTVYNNITSEEKLKLVNKENLRLTEDFLRYMKSLDRSETTIKGYRSDLKIIWTWNLDFNDNKEFVNFSKRDIANLQYYCMETWHWSTSRLARVKSTLSSLSNYIETILDDEYEDFKPIVKKIKNPKKVAVRDKTILSEEQVDYLLNELLNRNKIQQACTVALAAFCGCRISEITRFKVNYFNDSNIIFDSLYKTPEKIITKGKKLTKYITIDFKKYLDIWMKEREKLGINSEWLFVTKSDDDKWIQIKKCTLNSYARTCNRILDVHFYYHCMRHQLCTKLSSKYHLPSKIIQEFFGWASPDMINIYDDSEASDEFGKYFTKDGIKKVKETSFSDL